MGEARELILKGITIIKFEPCHDTACSFLKIDLEGLNYISIC